MSKTNTETNEEKAASHKGWGRSLWYTAEMSAEGKARALECAKAAGDAVAVAHLESIQ
jgi:hypothetical protein